MYYSDEIIEKVREGNDIVDVISSYVTLQKRGATYFGLCPFHSEKTPSFSVTPSKQMYYCFGCHKGGNVISFLMDYENYTFQEALQALADRARIELPKQEETGEQRRQNDLKKTILEINNKAGKYFYHQLKTKRGENALAYLHRRELDDETITRWGLGYSNPYRDDLYRAMKKEGYTDDVLAQTGLFHIDTRGAGDKFWNRVMFPIFDANSRVIGFGGRVMGDGEPKYLNSPETPVFDKGRNLYGLNIARKTRRKYLLLCEGYMDVISLHKAGFDNAVATLGTALTGGQANLLKRYTDQVILTYDSDGAGIRAARRAIPILRQAGISVKVLNMDPWKDPDEFIKNEGADAYEERIRKAKNFFFFEMDVQEKGFDMSDPEQKTGFHRALAAELVKFSEEIERENYLKAACARYHISEEGLRKLLAGMGRASKITVEEDRAEREAERQERTRRKSDSGLKIAERMLLTWLVNDPALYPKVREIIRPEDFTDGVYEECAKALFAQMDAGKVEPAAILDRFMEDEESRQTAAEIFHTEPAAGMTDQDRGKAFSDIVKNIKKNALEAALKTAGPEEYTKLLKEKKALEKLEIRL